MKYNALTWEELVERAESNIPVYGGHGLSYATEFEPNPGGVRFDGRGPWIDRREYENATHKTWLKYGSEIDAHRATVESLETLLGEVAGLLVKAKERLEEAEEKAAKEQEARALAGVAS